MAPEPAVQIRCVSASKQLVHLESMTAKVVETRALVSSRPSVREGPLTATRAALTPNVVEYG
jgi:hypothetical protein